MRIMKPLFFSLQRILLTAAAACLLTMSNVGHAQSTDGLSITIVQPTNGASFPGPTNIGLIAGVAASNDTAAIVEFFDNSQPIGVSSNWAVVDPPGSPGLPPGSHAYFFDWTNQSLGSHVITASATDTNGNTFWSDPVTVIVGKVTNPPPIVQITQPANGSTFTVPANVMIDASVNDPGGDVAYVLFTAGPPGGSLRPVLELGVVSNWVSLDPPERIYEFDWTNALEGTWLLVATAVGSNGTFVASTPVQVSVLNNFLFSVDIISPTNGATFPGPTNIGLLANVTVSNDFVTNVEFFDDSQPIGSGVVIDASPVGHIYLFDWTNQSLGSHVITATATDTNGNTASSAPVTITVGSITNSPPIVRITSPPNMTVFRAPVNVTLVAYAEDPDGPVQSVEFFAGTNGVGFGQPVPIAVPVGPVVLADTFELIWSNAPPGDYALTALATDGDGGSATSAPVNITILSVAPPPTNLPDVVSIVATDPVAIAGTNCWAWLGGPLTWSNWVSPTAVWRWHTNCGPIDATFTVSRFGDTNSDLVVNYTIGGTATNGVDDVALPGSVTIPAGQTAATITIVPMDGGGSNVSGTVILALEPATNSPGDYAVGFLRSAEAIIIGSVLPAPGPPGRILADRSFHLSLTGPEGAWFHIDYSTNLVNWTPVCTNQVINGSIDFVDPDAATSPVREYRAVPMANPPGD